MLRRAKRRRREVSHTKTNNMLNHTTESNRPPRPNRAKHNPVMTSRHAHPRRDISLLICGSSAIARARQTVKMRLHFVNSAVKTTCFAAVLFHLPQWLTAFHIASHRQIQSSARRRTARSAFLQAVVGDKTRAENRQNRPSTRAGIPLVAG